MRCACPPVAVPRVLTSPVQVRDAGGQSHPSEHGIGRPNVTCLHASAVTGRLSGMDLSLSHPPPESPTLSNVPEPFQVVNTVVIKSLCGDFWRRGTGFGTTGWRGAACMARRRDPRTKKGPRPFSGGVGRRRRNRPFPYGQDRARRAQRDFAECHQGRRGAELETVGPSRRRRPVAMQDTVQHKLGDDLRCFDRPAPRYSPPTIELVELFACGTPCSQDREKVGAAGATGHVGADRRSGAGAEARA